MPKAKKKTSNRGNPPLRQETTTVANVNKPRSIGVKQAKKRNAVEETCSTPEKEVILMTNRSSMPEIVTDDKNSAAKRQKTPEKEQTRSRLRGKFKAETSSKETVIEVPEGDQILSIAVNANDSLYQEETESDLDEDQDDYGTEEHSSDGEELPSTSDEE